MAIDPAEQLFLETAVRRLERPGTFIRLANAAGKPAEMILERLPEWARNSIQRAVMRALTRAIDWAAVTVVDGAGPRFERLPVEPGRISALTHTVTAGALGALGGFFGLAALPIELPITTLVMLRSIAAIAQQSGSDLRLTATRLECVSVLSMGGPSNLDDRMESSYLSTRAGLGLLMREASGFIAGKSAAQISQAIEEGTAPQVVRLIAKIGSRFGYVAADLAYAEMVPVVGAMGGLAVNAAFTNYFNGLAQSHFGIRRLERVHGEAAVRREIERIRAGMA
jgi:EcsC protein family